jgi:hypothetical protein
MPETAPTRVITVYDSSLPYVGFIGNTYNIPTRLKNFHPLPLKAIEFFVDGFLMRAEEHPDWHFLLTRVGCGLSGYKDEDICPMFVDAPANVLLPGQWEKEGWLNDPA